jgi:hypothetical protein
VIVFGYLDASSGSMLVGAVAAGAAGVAVAAKVGWRRVTGVFSRKGDDIDAGDVTDTGADPVEPGTPAADPS